MKYTYPVVQVLDLVHEVVVGLVGVLVDDAVEVGEVPVEVDIVRVRSAHEEVLSGTLKERKKDGNVTICPRMEEKYIQLL